MSPLLFRYEGGTCAVAAGAATRHCQSLSIGPHELETKRRIYSQTPPRARSLTHSTRSPYERTARISRRPRQRNLLASQPSIHRQSSTTAAALATTQTMRSTTPPPSSPPASISTPIPAAPAPQPQLTIRFSTPLPDLHLPLPYASAATTTVAALKQHIRANLPAMQRAHGLRLIASGRLLADDGASIATALRLRLEPSLPPPERLFVHASVAEDPLDAAALAAEVALAVVAPAKPGGGRGSDDGRAGDGDVSARASASASTSPAPRGFDRLGLPAADTAALRSQHRALVAARHTPADMPDGAALLRLEDAWVDSGSSAASAGVGAGATDDDDDASAALDDALYGAVMGFLWPLGAAVVGLRSGEDNGVWSRRRRGAVWVGVGVNVAFGLLKLLGG